jgi:hypothetical protein
MGLRQHDGGGGRARRRSQCGTRATSHRGSNKGTGWRDTGREGVGWMRGADEEPVGHGGMGDDKGLG